MAELVAMTVRGGVPEVGGQGGGIQNSGNLTLKDSIVTSNGGPGTIWDGTGFEGGGIHNSGTLTVEDSTIQGNDSYTGCGIHNVGTATLVNSIVADNGGPSAPPYLTLVEAGSGIFNEGGSLTLIDSVVSGNQDGGGDAAAIDSHRTGTMLLLINSVVSENVSSQSGSIFSTGGPTTLINSTVSGNIGLVDGIEWWGTLKLISSTVVQIWGWALGTYGSEPAELIMANSIIVGGTEPCLGTLHATSWGGNIESPTNDCGLTHPTDLVNVSAEDLALGPLQDNGGPTMTHALLPGSVAIDRIPEAMCVDADGQPLTTDQRGEPRPETGGDSCDVGAFEVQP
jgi:hypothetical protein